MNPAHPRNGRPPAALLLGALLGVFFSFAPLIAHAGPALAGGFLSAGLTEALTRLGAAVDSQDPGWNSHGSSDTSCNNFPCFRQTHRLWSVTLFDGLDEATPGSRMFAGHDGRGDDEFQLTPVVLTGANEAHGAQTLKFEITTPRFQPFAQQPTPVKVFALELGAPDADTPLLTGSYHDAAAAAAAGAPLLDVFLGNASCRSAARSFDIDALSYVGGELATAVVRFRCGKHLRGVLRYDDTQLSGTQRLHYSGRVWEDENADGVQAGDGLNPPDAPFNGVVLNLLREGRRIASTRSDSRGDFDFEAPAGLYRVAVEPPAGFQVTARDVGSDELRDSDVDSSSGRGDPQTLVAPVEGQVDATPFLTIGLTRPGGRASLPLPSARFQTLIPGDRVSYEIVNGATAYATDTVLPGARSTSGSIVRRVQDSAGNELAMSNDGRGLRLHRAVVGVAGNARRFAIEFTPPLVLLPATVENSEFNGGGSVSVRRVDAGAGQSPTIMLRYAARNTLTSGADQHREAFLSVSRNLSFSGRVRGTPLDSATPSNDTYALGIGLVSSGVLGADYGTRLTATRRGLGQDFDGDRRADLLALDLGSVRAYPTSVPTPSVPYPDGDNADLLAWHPHSSSTSPQLLGRIPLSPTLSGDFDGDGNQELVSVDQESGLVSLLVAADGTVTSRPFSFTPPHLEIFASGDFKRDGHTGIVWHDTDTDQLSYWTLDDDPLPQTALLHIATGAPLRVPAGWRLAGVGDFDADGSSDLLWRAVTGNRIALWAMNGAERRQFLVLPGSDTRARVVAVNDFDGDGHCDVLWQDPATHELMLWTMDGAVVKARKGLGKAPLNASLVASGDYDGNGSADLLWKNANQQLTLWLVRNGAVYSSSNAGLFTRDGQLLQ